MAAVPVTSATNLSGGHGLNPANTNPPPSRTAVNRATSAAAQAGFAFGDDPVARAAATGRRAGRRVQALSPAVAGSTGAARAAPSNAPRPLPMADVPPAVIPPSRASAAESAAPSNTARPLRTTARNSTPANFVSLLDMEAVPSEAPPEVQIIRNAFTGADGKSYDLRIRAKDGQGRTIQLPQAGDPRLQFISHVAQESLQACVAAHSGTIADYRIIQQVTANRAVETRVRKQDQEIAVTNELRTGLEGALGLVRGALSEQPVSATNNNNMPPVRRPTLGDTLRRYTPSRMTIAAASGATALGASLLGYPAVSQVAGIAASALSAQTVTRGVLSAAGTAAGTAAASHLNLPCPGIIGAGVGAVAASGILPRPPMPSPRTALAGAVGTAALGAAYWYGAPYLAPLASGAASVAASAASSTASTVYSYAPAIGNAVASGLRSARDWASQLISQLWTQSSNVG